MFKGTNCLTSRSRLSGRVSKGFQSYRREASQQPVSGISCTQTCWSTQFVAPGSKKGATAKWLKEVTWYSVCLLLQQQPVDSAAPSSPLWWGRSGGSAAAHVHRSEHWQRPWRSAADLQPRSNAGVLAVGLTVLAAAVVVVVEVVVLLYCSAGTTISRIWRVLFRESEDTEESKETTALRGTACMEVYMVCIYMDICIVSAMYYTV